MAQHAHDEDALRLIRAKMIEYLSKADMAEQRLVDRIVRLRIRYPHTERYRGYTKENARRVIEDLRADGLVNEERFAAAVFTGLLDRYDGPALIRQKMMRRQISGVVVNRIVREYESAGQTQNYERIIARAQKKAGSIQKKVKHRPGKEAIVRQRLYQWLRGRGYRHDECMHIIKMISE